ncbi:hypothetical protein GCM10009843_18290 [Nocardioides bigeumensis]|uniref:Alpha/beta hydrolase n=1 Tax=Nocardioides bigeumensis TaxID=433657 RepID=A0ABP5K0B1_9ACTN
MVGVLHHPVRSVSGDGGGEWRVALVERAAHALNYSHPGELAGLIERWLPLTRW